MKYTGPLNFILRENVMWEWTDATELYHYGKGHDDNPPGRGSGRYPWGSGEKNANLGERANKTARSISKSLKDYAVKRRRNKNLQKARAAKAEKAAEKKRLEQEELKKQEEKERRKAELERILKSGTVSEILENKDAYNSQELNEAYNRLKNEENLKSLLPKEKTTLDKIVDAKGKVDKVLGVVDTGINTWNRVAKISNSLMGTSIKTINDQQNAQKKELTRAAKEAKKIMDEYKGMALEAIDAKELASILSKLNSLNNIEKLSK